MPASFAVPWRERTIVTQELNIGWAVAETASLEAATVLAAQDGDTEALGWLYEKYAPIVTSIAYRRLGSRTEAQEVCQDTFVQVLLKLKQLRSPESCVGWLKSIAHRTAINRGSRQRRFAASDPVWLDATEDKTASPLEVVLKDERSRVVRDGLGHLKELDRRTLVAFYLEGKSLRQMARQFSAPEGTIKRRLHDARKRLSRRVENLTAV